MIKIAVCLILAMAQAGVAQPFLNKEWRGDRLLLAQANEGNSSWNETPYSIKNWRPWQRRTVLICTVAGAAGFGYYASKAHTGATAAGVLGGAMIGFVSGYLLVPAIDEVYFLWSGRHMEPWSTFRFSFPASQVG